MAFELYHKSTVLDPIKVTINQVGIAVIRQGEAFLILPYADWGKFVDACERFYTEGEAHVTS